MKLIVQIPCFNEAATLPLVFQGMPRAIPGIETIEFLVIDDGSTDFTQAVARQLGVHHYLRVSGRNRRWLGRAFKLGTERALALGADIVVNTDGDNQYPSHLIPQLISPILSGTADIVIGDRSPSTFHEFSLFKRLLQLAGNKLIERLVAAPVPDAVSGFRAYSRKALLQLNVITNFTYTIDTLIQAEKKGLDIAWMPIEPNPKTRESRLISSSLEKARRSGLNIFRLLSIYEPFRSFAAAAALFLLPAVILLGRFGYFYLFVHERASGHIQSVVIGGACLVIGVMLLVFAVLAGLLNVNRILLEDILIRLKRLEYRESDDDKQQENPHSERISGF